MELQELHEKIKNPKRFYVLLYVNVEGMHLYLEQRIDAVSKQDAVHMIQHRLESANEKYVDLTDLNWLVRKIYPVRPSKSAQRARRRAAKKD